MAESVKTQDDVSEAHLKEDGADVKANMKTPPNDVEKKSTSQVEHVRGDNVKTDINAETALKTENIESADSALKCKKSESPPSDLEKKIIRQVEFYFGDANLMRDKFLIEQLKLDDGWVTLETMLKFNRLNQLSKSEEEIATALKKSTDLIMVSDDNKKIRRVPPVPGQTEELEEELKTRYVYVKGFQEKATLDEIQDFMEGYGKIELIGMRRNTKTKVFKGSCFVLFATDKDAKAFINLPEVKLNDQDLIRLFKNDYLLKKKAERKEKGTDGDKSKSGGKKEDEAKSKRQSIIDGMTKGAILEVTGLPAQTKREALKSYFLKYGTVQWIDYDQGNDKARLRFKEENEAKTALEKVKAESAEGKVMVNDVEVACTVLEGETEIDHWVSIDMARKYGRDSKGGRGGGGRGGSRGRGGFDRRGGGRGGGRGRGGRDGRGKRGNDESDEPESKKQKADDSDNGGDGGSDSD